MATKNVLIIGVNGGIGLNLVKAFAALSWDVTGSIRPQSKTDPSVNDLEATGAKILELDFLDESSIVEAVKEYGDKPLDNSIVESTNRLASEAKALAGANSGSIVEKFQTMAVGSYLTTKHFLPNLERSSAARVVNVSSAFGSVTGNTFGICMAYPVAKTALNQVVMTFAREFEKEGRNVTVVCVEPGFLATRLTDYDSVDGMETCITGLMKVIRGLTREDSGQFIEWSGTRLRF